MTINTLPPNTEESAQPIPRAMLFANGSMTAFDSSIKITRFERKQSDGSAQKVALYEGVPIFRSGVFADSMGYRKEWLPEQMHQMAANFDYLRRTGIFADVPVRVGHPSFLGGNPLKDVIGYFSALEVEERESPIDGDDEKYTYLLASFEVLDEDADKKIQSGLWRNRSSEIGTFFTNDPETELWPVMMGVAYVDIPAVQGLNGFAKQNQTESFSIQMEAPVTGTTATSSNPEAPKPALPSTASASAAAPASSLAEFTIGGTRTNDFARVQSYITELEKSRDEFSAQVTRLTGEVTALKEYKAETMKAGREQRLTMLTMSTGDRPAILTAPELEQEKAFTALLDDDQFDAYMKRLEMKAGNPILGSYGAAPMDENHRPGGVDENEAKASEVASLKDVVKGMSFSKSMTPDRIKATDVYKKLIALDPTFTLA